MAAAIRNRVRTNSSDAAQRSERLAAKAAEMAADVAADSQQRAERALLRRGYGDGIHIIVDKITKKRTQGIPLSVRVAKLQQAQQPEILAIEAQQVYTTPVAPLPSPAKEVVSSPSARPMTPRDINSVGFISLEQARELLKDVVETHPAIDAHAIRKIEAEWKEWLTAAERFTLTAMAARKFRNQAMWPHSRRDW